MTQTNYKEDRAKFLSVFDKLKDGDLVLCVATEDVERAKKENKRTTKIVGLDNLNGNKYLFDRVHNEQGQTIISAFRDVLRRIAIPYSLAQGSNGYKAKFDAEAITMQKANILCYVVVKNKILTEDEEIFIEESKTMDKKGLAEAIKENTE